MKFPHRFGKLTMLSTAAVVLVGATAYATIPDSPTNVIHGCYGKSSGALRVIDDATSQCSRGEIALTWNQQGEQGGIGPVGPQGSPGMSGNNGVDGAQGPAGPVGPQGVSGDRGQTGAQGDQGVPGVNGVDGLDGDAGPQGPAGPAGVPGPQGPAGQAGAQGPAGTPGGADHAFQAGVTAASQTIACGPTADYLTRVTFDTEKYDDSDAYNPATSTYTVQEAGLYQVGARILLVPPAPGDNELLVYRNGYANREWLDLDHVATGAGAEILDGTTVMRLAVGDVLEIRYFCGPATTSATISNAAPGYNSFWVHRIG
jgi:Collagen triple helix repeat (20 copies)